MRKVLAEGVTLDIWVYVLMVVALVVGSFGGAYLKRKGENWATKEDFETLLSQLRRTTEETEKIKSDIAKFNWVEQRRWELKRDLYTDILETLGAIQAAVIDATHAMDKGGKKQSFVESLTKLLGLFQQLDRIRATAGITFNKSAMDTIEELISAWTIVTQADGERPHKLKAIGDIAGRAQHLLTEAAKNDLLIGETQEAK